MQNKVSIKSTNQQVVFKSRDLFELFSFKADLDLSFCISTDSRQIEPSQIFLPLFGEKFDGHDFIDEVLDKKILYSFCEKSKLQKVRNEAHRTKLIVVESSLDAYHKLAKQYLNRIKPKVIAVTGSSGKTTVKELIASVLSTRFRVHKTKANYNNEFGVPKTILEMPQDTEILILELAMRGEGQIRYLSKTAEPDIGIITNVGSAHIGLLGSKKSIIKAKCELLSELRKDGIAVLFNDKELVSYAKTVWEGNLQTFGLSMLEKLSYSGGITSLVYKGEKFVIKAQGEIYAFNSLCAILVAYQLGLNADQVREGLASFQIPNGRGNVVPLKGNIFLIDESYNANPESVKAAVKNVIDSWDKSYKKVLVLGELAELGDHKAKLLSDLNLWLDSKDLYRVITVGNALSEITSGRNVKNIEECCDILKDLLRPDTVFVIKGSHIAGLNKVVEYLVTAQPM